MVVYRFIDTILSKNVSIEFRNLVFKRLFFNSYAIVNYTFIHPNKNTYAFILYPHATNLNTRACIFLVAISNFIFILSFHYLLFFQHIRFHKLTRTTQLLSISTIYDNRNKQRYVENVFIFRLIFVPASTCHHVFELTPI